MGELRKGFTGYNVFIGIISIAIFLTIGCSGGDGGGGSVVPTPQSPTATTLSGTAAAGAPIKGEVCLRDAMGTTRCQGIEDNGEFLFDLEGLTPPYLLWVDGIANAKGAFLYSMSPGSGRVNVTPATDCIMAMALGTNPVSHYRENPTAEVPDANKTEAAERKIAALLAALFKSTGVTADFDLMTSQFTTNGTGFDGIMEVIEMSGDEEYVRILDRNSLTELFKQEIATGNVVKEETPERVNELGQAGMDVLDAAQDILETFASQFATARPTYEQLLAVMQPLISDEFMDEGSNREDILTFFANDGPMGFNFENFALYRKMKQQSFGDASPWFIDELPNGYYEGVWVTYTWRNGNRVAHNITAFVRETADGPWKWHGDQNPFPVGGIVEAESVWQRWWDRVRILSGLRLRTEDRNNAAFDNYGIISFMVHNDALPNMTSPSGNNYKAIVLSKDPDPSVLYNINSTYWTWRARHFEKDGLDINAITNREFIFVGLDSSSNPVHIWIDLLDKKPVKEAVLWRDTLDSTAIGGFSSYFSELLSIWGNAPEVYIPESSLNSSSIPLQWQLSPMGDHVNWAEVGLRDSNDAVEMRGALNPAFDDATLSLADWVSTTLDISTLGIAWPPVRGWSYLQTRDEFLRRYGTEIDFRVAEVPDPRVSITGQYLQYRTYSDSAYNKFRGWIDLLDLGLPIEDTIADIALTNLTTSTTIPIEKIAFDENVYFSNWSGNMTNNELSPVWEVVYYSGYGVHFPAGTDLPAGEYQYDATTQDGDTVSSPVITLGNRVELPVVDVASMASEWNNGDLELSWQNQTVPQGTQIRIWIVKGEVDEFNVYLATTVPQDFQEVIIPKRMIDSAKILNGVDSASWRLQYQYSENNINTSRGVSDWVEIPNWN